jgi:hypothetical protein
VPCGRLPYAEAGAVCAASQARAPYFHNGAAASLNQVVNFYNDRFRVGLTEEVGYSPAELRQASRRELL